MASNLSQHGRIRLLWDYLRTSFWFVPGILALAGLGLLLAARRMEGGFEAGGSSGSWWLYQGTAENARNLLSTLLASMITMAALVFSITMVVLTLAANQFGPRLVRNFMASPQTQFILGAFVMTIIYCLLALASAGGDGEGAYVSVSVALALTIGSVALLVFYLHMLGRSIVSETVIERVGRELDDMLEDMEPAGEAGPDPRPSAAAPDEGQQTGVRLGVARAGYVQAVRYDRLAALAAAADVQIALRFRPGDYLVEHGQDITVWPPELLTPELASDIRQCVLLGPQRTPVQDPEFPIRHLVEIAVRALSPGVNDPYTAAAVLGRLSAGLSRLMSRRIVWEPICDGESHARVFHSQASYATLIAASFDQIRQNATDKPLILIHLTEAIWRVAEHARLDVQLDALDDQLQRMRRSLEAVPEPSDRSDVERRLADAAAAVQRRRRELEAERQGPGAHGPRGEPAA